MSFSLEIKGADGTQKLLSAIPGALALGMQGALNRGLQRYRTWHAAQRLKKAPPPMWRGRSGPEGVHATRKAGIGLLGAWHVEIHGKTLMGMYGKLGTRNIIAKQQEDPALANPGGGKGWAPLPPARDRLGRTLKKYSALRQARKLIVFRRRSDGKHFLIMRNPKPGWKRSRGQARRQGFSLVPNASQQWAFIFLFHQIKQGIFRARLDFHALFPTWLAREGRGIFWKALTGATHAAQRRLGGGK